jgi:hypothetical protein
MGPLRGANIGFADVIGCAASPRPRKRERGSLEAGVGESGF